MARVLNLYNANQTRKIKMTIKAEIRQMRITTEGIQGDPFDVLYVNNRPLHWDTPEEHAGQLAMAQQCYGAVLCAGYGLGIVQGYLMKMPKVKTITTVEKYQAVIAEGRKRMGIMGHGTLIVKDIYDYFTEGYTGHFDCIIGDIWSGTVGADVAGYKKFRKAARLHLKPGGKIIMGGGRENT